MASGASSELLLGGLTTGLASRRGVGAAREKKKASKGFDPHCLKFYAQLGKTLPNTTSFPHPLGVLFSYRSADLTAGKKIASYLKQSCAYLYQSLCS